MLLGVAGCCWSQTPRPIVTDVAPAPSARFPASWYPPDNDVTSTGTPTVGAPYTAVLVTTSWFRNQATGEVHVFTQNGRQARDAAGRRREETEMPRPDGHGGTIMAHEVSVNDPVSHCSFQWMEPWVADGEPVATVSCMPRTLHYNGHEMYGDSLVSERREVHEPTGDVYLSEPLGKRSFGDFEAEGVRNTKTIERNGKTQRLVTELWYALALKELLEFKKVPEPNSKEEMSVVPDFELTKIHRGEPDPALFYPPPSYEIRSGR
jgi:hypothetical protein